MALAASAVPPFFHRCVLQIPQFYAPVPPAPAGLIWYQYAPGVPALPTVSSVLGSAYSGYTWIYDSNYATSSFQFSNLDKVRRRRAERQPCRTSGFRGILLPQQSLMLMYSV